MSESEYLHVLEDIQNISLAIPFDCIESDLSNALCIIGGMNFNHGSNCKKRWTSNKVKCEAYTSPHHESSFWPEITYSQQGYTNILGDLYGLMGQLQWRREERHHSLSTSSKTFEPPVFTRQLLSTPIPQPLHTWPPCSFQRYYKQSSRIGLNTFVIRFCGLWHLHQTCDSKI